MSPIRPNEDSPLDAPPLTGGSGILIVDEDPAFQLGLKTFLREYVGFEKVFIARNGQEALDFIRAEPTIDVVTLDYRMPEMTGIEVLQILREAPSRPLAVLMITGYPSDELESEFRSLGTDTLLTTHFISKPVQFEKLEHLVLSAHDEVRIAKRHALARTATETPAFSDSELPVSLLVDRLDQQTSRIEDLERQLKSQRGKWRSDFWKIAFLLLSFWLAGEFGLLKKIEPHWENLKETITASFSTKVWGKAPTHSVDEEILPTEADKGQPL